MQKTVRDGDVIQVPDELIGETVIDEVFDLHTALRFKKSHALASRCDKFIARDPGDNLIVEVAGNYHYWDHASDRLISLGPNPNDFVVRYEE